MKFKPRIDIYKDNDGWYGYVNLIPVGMGGQLYKLGYRAARFKKKETLKNSINIAVKQRENGQ
jgi:hypothetical protein